MASMPSPPPFTAHSTARTPKAARERACGRPPAPAEKDRSLSYIQDDPARLKGFAWLLYNLDEFIYIR